MKKFFLFLTLLVLQLVPTPRDCSAQSWSTFGTGMTCMSGPDVKALKVFNNELIAGGWFTTAGGVSVNRIAKWNGANWSPLSSGLESVVNALTIFNNELIAGGWFTTAGGVGANYIAKWSGTAWSTLGSGLGGEYAEVYALTVFNNELIAGGAFITAGGVSANNIAKWNGTSWAPLGSGVAGGTYKNVYALTIYNNELIAGGDFTTAGGVSASRIAKWNGTSWSSLGSGLGGYVYAFTVYNNELIASGHFNTAGGVSANNIAKWNGTTWSPLGNGIGGEPSTGPTVYSLTVLNNGVAVGGRFTIAGTINVANIARWGPEIGIKQINQNIPDKFNLSQNYPNPFNPTTNIKYQITNNSFVSLKIFDMLGKEVAILVNEKQTPGTYEVDWNAENITSGVYYYSLIAEDFRETKRMVLVK